AAAVGAGAAVKAAQVVKVVRAAKAGTPAIGTASSLTSNLAGRVFVGRGATKTAAGHLISADGLKRYRPPTLKQSGNQAGKIVANFEQRITRQVSSRRAWNYPNRFSNSHLTIRKGW